MVGYNKNCKICNCEQRAQVEQMREDGSSLQQIVDFLAGHGVTLSKPAVKRHFDTHFPVREEVAKRYAEQSMTVMEQAVERRLDDIEMIDAMIERNYKLHSLASESVQESLTEEVPVYSKDGIPILDPETGEQMKRKFAPAKSIVDLVTGANNGFIQALKLKAELLGDKEPDGNVIKVVLPEGFDVDDDDSS